MLQIHKRTGEYQFFNAGANADLLAHANQELAYVRQETSLLSVILPDSQDLFSSCDPVLHGYCQYQALQIIEAMIRANKATLECQGHNVKSMRWETFHLLYKTGVLPKSVAKKVDHLQKFRNRIAHGAALSDVASTYDNLSFLCGLANQYVQCVQQGLVP